MAVCLAALKLQAQQPTTPYRVHVVGEDAVIHSGPSSNFYGTDRLPPGATVDVYRDDPGGWMAIRPPEGSFSLVQLDELELLENGLARITVDKAVAWVGTRLTAVKKPMWQVRLRRGEVVDVLGIVDRQKYELGQEEPDWVQIKPPAGEFRWIAATNLDLRNTEPIHTDDEQRTRQTFANQNQPNETIVNDQWSTEPEGAIIPRDLHLAPPPRDITRRMAPIGALDAGTGSTGFSDEWSMDIEPAPVNSDWTGQPSLDMDLSRSVAPDNPNNGWRPAQQPITNFVAERSEFNADGSRVQQDLPVWNQSMASTGTSSSHARSDVFDSTDSYTSAGNFGSPANPTTSIPNGMPLDGSLTSLEWRLSQEMLKQSPQQWDLQGIARDVQYLNDSTPDPQIRAATGRMLEKIRKCREIQAGYEATDGPAPGDLITHQFNSNGQFNNLQATGIGLAANNELLNQYDAYGWLCELIVNGGMGQSRFAIKDDAGRITHEITALPGLNLRRYLNQRVGIVGSRGFDQKLNLNHVTAERVIPVDTLRR